MFTSDEEKLDVFRLMPQWRNRKGITFEAHCEMAGMSESRMKALEAFEDLATEEELQKLLDAHTKYMCGTTSVEGLH